jgi:hypothetical protein
MKYLELFEAFNPSGDKLGFGKQIQSHIQQLVGKNFGTPYVVTSAEVTRAESQGYKHSDQSGEGDLVLTFKKEFPDELDDLISDLSSVGLSEERKIIFGWDLISEVENSDSSFGGNYHIPLWNFSYNIYTDSPVVFLEFPEIFRGEVKSPYDMSYGVGSAIQGLIEKTINSLVHESKMGNKNK